MIILDEVNEYDAIPGKYYSTKEFAAILGVPENNLRVWVHRKKVWGAKKIFGRLMFHENAEIRLNLNGQHGKNVTKAVILQL